MFTIRIIILYHSKPTKKFELHILHIKEFYGVQWPTGHYENTPMQYKEIFQLKKLKISMEKN